MKPEPLKGKGKKIVLDGHLYFGDYDIKSAVEWLKEDIEKMFEKQYIEGKEDKSCKSFMKKIDKAFEDVIKK